MFTLKSKSFQLQNGSIIKYFAHEVCLLFIILNSPCIHSECIPQCGPENGTNFRSITISYGIQGQQKTLFQNCKYPNFFTFLTLLQHNFRVRPPKQANAFPVPSEAIHCTFDRSGRRHLLCTEEKYGKRGEKFIF